jgi:hypothetical protein
VTDKVITTWYPINGTSGYGSITAQLKHLNYNSTHVWINTNSVPAYSVGPWDCPNVPTAVNKTFVNTDRADGQDHGSIGTVWLWRDGLIIYGPWDGQYYTSSAGYTGVWQRNAYF